MAWLPAGPTASKAAEIIPSLLVVSFLFSFFFVCAILLSYCSACRLFHAHYVGLQFSTNARTWVKDQLRLLCDRNTRGTIPPASYDTGLRIRVRDHNCAAQRRYLHGMQTGFSSTRGHEHAQVTTCKDMQQSSRGMQNKCRRPNAKSMKDATAISLHTPTTSGSDHPSLHHTAISSLESQ